MTAIRCLPQQSVVAPSGEHLQGRGRYGVVCRLKLCDPYLSALGITIKVVYKSTYLLMAVVMVIFGINLPPSKNPGGRYKNLMQVHNYI